MWEGEGKKKNEEGGLENEKEREKNVSEPEI